MKIEFINPFLQAISKVMENIGNPEIEKGQVYVKPATYTTNEITVIIGVSGKIKGQVVFTMSQETGKQIAKAMLGNFEFELSNEIAESAMSELANMITGNASIGLCDAGYNCDITPPTLIVGRDANISTVNIQTLVIPLIIKNLGQIEVNVALKDNEQN